MVKNGREAKNNFTQMMSKNFAFFIEPKLPYLVAPAPWISNGAPLYGPFHIPCLIHLGLKNN